MSHFAKINENGIVQEVIVAEQEFIDSLEDSSLWIQTSYNHNIRKQYAGLGYIYDKTNDVFITPQPFPSWSLDSNFDWQAPVSKPDDGKSYTWNEDTKSWVDPKDE